MGDPDATMPRIGHAIELSRQGDREAARHLFAAIWADIGESGDALYRYGLAHAVPLVLEPPAPGSGAARPGHGRGRAHPVPSEAA